jgi:hypothetical protein
LRKAPAGIWRNAKPRTPEEARYYQQGYDSRESAMLTDPVVAQVPVAYRLWWAIGLADGVSADASRVRPSAPPPADPPKQPTEPGNDDKKRTDEKKESWPLAVGVAVGVVSAGLLILALSDKGDR